MNRIVLLLSISILVCAVAVGQSSRGVYAYSADDERGWLGVSVEDVTKKLVDREKLKVVTGAYVSEVVDESPAEEAGIRDGDVIVKFAAKEIDDSDELIRAVRNSEPGDEVAIVLNRAGESKTVKVKLDEMETPRAYSFTVPSLPRVATTHPAPHQMGFFRSGERLGMEMQELGKQLAEYLEVPGNRGVLVTSVSKKGSAAKAGMKAGDVIVRVNRNSVRGVDDILDEIRDSDSATVPFDVIRKGKSMTVSVGTGSDDETSSLHLNLDRRELRGYKDALQAHAEAFHAKRENLDGLKEALMELKEELKENALELREKLREELRNL